MPPLRHAIKDCIQSSRTEVRPDLHLAEAETLYRDAVERLESVQKELAEREALFEQSSRYHKKLIQDEIASKLEVPTLKKELGGLKEKLISLTFETEKWARICRKQEKEIAELQERKSALTIRLKATENNLQAISQENSLLDKERAELASNIVSITAIRSEIDTFNHIVPCQQPFAEAEKLSSSHLVNDVNSIVSKIRSAKSSKQQVDAKIAETSATIGTLQKNVSATEQHIKELTNSCVAKNEAVASLDGEISSLSKQIHALQQHYQAYYELIEESTVVTDKRNALITTVNDENSALKESLLTCNRHEMVLRLEELKMIVFLKEMEGLYE